MELNDQWAVAMFSFTTDIVRGEGPDALRTAVGSGLSRRFEFDGFQHFGTLPDVTDAEAEAFRSDIADMGVTLTEMGIYDDLWRDPARKASVDERVAYLARQIRSAQRLGFGAVKLMWGVDLEILNRLRPCLEDTGLILNQEAQGSLHPDSPDVAERMAFTLKHPDSFGFVFDLSACMYGLPVTYIEELHRLRVPDDAIRLLAQEWADDRSGSLRDRALALSGDELTHEARLRLMMPFGRFGNSRVTEWRDFLPQVNVVHLKYWDLNDEDDLVSTPTRELAAELTRIGYSGPLTSEWGGHEWLDGGSFDGITMTRHHRLLCQNAMR